MNQRECFQLGFLAWCADQGYTAEQTLAHVKKATDKQAFLGAIASKIVGAPFDMVRAFGPGLLTAGSLAAVGLPVAGGLTAGWAANKMLQNQDTDAEEAKTDELLAEYDRLTEQAKRQTMLKSLRGQPTVGAAHLGNA